VKDVKFSAASATFGALLIAFSLPAVAAGQGQPVAAQFSASVKPIVDCVRATACRNMTATTINWFDMVGLPVQRFAVDGWTYAVWFQSGRPGEERLTFYLTPPGEPRPTESLSVDLNGHLVKAELGPQPGERVPSRESYDVWVVKHKVFSEAAWHPSGRTVGEEFRQFWQKLADQALAAAGRAIGVLLR